MHIGVVCFGGAGLVESERDHQLPTQKKSNDNPI